MFCPKRIPFLERERESYKRIPFLRERERERERESYKKTNFMFSVVIADAVLNQI